MEIQLKRLRREAGFKSRDSFAAALGGSCNARQIKSWETGERMMSLEQACVLADFLHCSLDELAGRHFSPSVPELADPMASDLVRHFSNLSEEGREVAVNVLAGMESTYPQGDGSPGVVEEAV